MGRFPWNEWVEVIGRTQEAVGGPAELEEMSARRMGAFLPFQLAARLVVSPRQLYLLFLSRLPQRIYTNAGARVESRPDGRLLFSYRIGPEWRGSLPHAHATLGLVRAYPRLLGLPDAVVDAKLGQREASFLVTVPSSGTAIARLRRSAGRLLTVPSAEHLDQLAELLWRESDFARRAQAIGERLLSAGREGLWAELWPVLERNLCCESATLWVVGPSGARQILARAGGPESPIRWSRSLTVDGREVGRLDLDLPEPDPGQRDELLDQLLPWVAAALHVAARQTPQTAVAAAGQADGPVARPGPSAWATRWQLTPRQRQVLGLLVRGLSNKEIAAALGCSPRTIDVIVSQILQRTGTSSRGVLAARCLTPEG